ncbi:MAG: hypothetical protein IPH04_05650 [Saprospirales bacterium]|nr:hypothetical protein [Saprospirales bacterium]
MPSSFKSVQFQINFQAMKILKPFRGFASWLWHGFSYALRSAIDLKVQSGRGNLHGFCPQLVKRLSGRAASQRGQMVHNVLGRQGGTVDVSPDGVLMLILADGPVTVSVWTSAIGSSPAGKTMDQALARAFLVSMRRRRFGMDVRCCSVHFVPRKILMDEGKLVGVGTS